MVGLYAMDGKRFILKTHHLTILGHFLSILSVLAENTL